MSAIPAGDNIAGAVICYTCHEPGPDAGGEPLRRDCACRGEDAGFVHLSCLAVYAAYMSRNAETLSGFTTACERCSICKQRFRGRFANNMAIELGTVMEQEYQDDTPSNSRRQVVALGVWLSALEWLPRRLTLAQQDDIMVLANHILSSISRMRERGFRVGTCVSKVEAQAFGMMGRVTLCGESRGYAMTACRLFESQLRASGTILDARGVAQAQDNILEAMTHGDYDSCTNSGWVRIRRRIYNLRVIRLGVGDESTIRAGIDYAHRLQLDDQWGEAQELLEELKVTSRERLGRVHPATVEINRMLVVRRGRER